MRRRTDLIVLDFSTTSAFIISSFSVSIVAAYSVNCTNVDLWPSPS